MTATDTLLPTVNAELPGLTASQAAECVLALDISHDRFRYAVWNADGLLRGLEDYSLPSFMTARPLTEALPGMVQEHPVLQHTRWASVRVSVNSPAFTLVPGPLFRKEYAPSYLALMQGGELGPLEVAQSYAHGGEYVSVFSMPYALRDWLAEQYPLQTVPVCHQTSALIEAAATFDKESVLTLYFEGEFVTLVWMKDKQLQYCNRFGYKTSADLTYYVLYVLEELHLDPATVPMRFYGEITPFADTYAELTRFLPEPEFGTLPPGLSLGDMADTLPDHRYLPLYGLAFAQ